MTSEIPFPKKKLFIRKVNKNKDAEKDYTTPPLFSDKFIPTALQDLTFNIRPAHYLLQLAKHKFIPNLIINGKSGSGKKLLAFLFIKSIFGEVSQRKSVISLDLPDKNKVVEIPIVSSLYHYELDLSHGNYDKHVIQSFIKEIAKSPTIGSTLKSQNLLQNLLPKCIVLHNADRLTFDAQQSLRRTLEQYTDLCRFILISSNINNITYALKSRCIVLQTNTPTKQDVFNILENISKTINQNTKNNTNTNINNTNTNTNINNTNTNTPQREPIEKIIKEHNNDVFDCVGALQCFLEYTNSLPTQATKPNTKPNTKNMHQSLDNECRNIIKKICNSKSINTIHDIRIILRNLLINNYPEHILNSIFNILFLSIKETTHKQKLVKLCDYYDYALKNGQTPLYHLEGLIVGIYKLLHTPY